MAKFAYRFPVLAAFLLPAAVFLFIDLAAAASFPLLYRVPDPRVAYYLADILPYLAGIAFCGLLLWRAGLWPRLGLGRRGFWSGLFFGGLLIISSVFDFVDYVKYLDPATFTAPSPALFGACLLDVLLIGLSEELIFRGGVLNLLLRRWGHTKRGIFRAAILSSVIFGAVHFTNWVYYPQLFWSTMSQMVYAAFFGVMIAAAYIRSRNLWAAALLHAIFNSSLILSVFSTQAAALEYTDISPFAAVYGVFTSAPFLLLGLAVLHGVQPEPQPNQKEAINHG